MFHLVHPSFGALAAIQAHGKTAWEHLDGRKPMPFFSKREALSTAADLRLNGEEQFLMAVEVSK